MFNHASGQLLPEHTWNPRCAQNFSWTHVQEDIRATAARAHGTSPPLGPHTKCVKMFMRQDCCANRPQAHLDLSPCTKRQVASKRLLHSHAASTLGSLSVCKQTCSCDNTAAFARCEHTWISLRAQGDMFRRKNCCVLTPPAHLDLAPCAKRRDMLHRKDCCDLTPRAHLDLSACASKNTCSCDRLLGSHATSTLDLSPCAKRHVPAKRMLRSHAASTLGSRSVRKETRHVISKRRLRSRAAPQDR